jgi:hypothetical protein
MIALQQSPQGAVFVWPKTVKLPKKAKRPHLEATIIRARELLPVPDMLMGGFGVEAGIFLAWMLKHQVDGVKWVQNPRRKQICAETGLTGGGLSRSIRQLLEAKVLKLRYDATTKTGWYRVEPEQIQKQLKEKRL